MADRSLSITIILNDPEEDVFSVVAEDKTEDMLVDVTASYEVQSATLPDGRIGVVVVAKLEHSSHIDPFDMPDEESL
jgi:hypothetical protein